jgi:hypothetical protein
MTIPTPKEISMTTTSPTLTVTFEVTVTNQTLHDIFVTAIEGGINYWCRTVEYLWANEDGTEDLDGFYAVIWDHEDGVERLINADTIRLGLARCAAGHSSVGELTKSTALLLLVGDTYRGMGIDVDYDAWIADAIVQMALFGEVVYG